MALSLSLFLGDMSRERKRPPPLLAPARHAATHGSSVVGTSKDIALWLESICKGYARYGSMFASAGFEGMHDILECPPSEDSVNDLLSAAGSDAKQPQKTRIWRAVEGLFTMNNGGKEREKENNAKLVQWLDRIKPGFAAFADALAAGGTCNLTLAEHTTTMWSEALSEKFVTPLFFSCGCSTALPYTST